MHVHPDPDELGRVYQPTLAIAASAAAVRRGAGARAARSTARHGVSRPRAAHAEYLENLRHTPQPGDLDMGEVIAHLRERAARRRDLHQRRRQLRGAGLHRFYRVPRATARQLAPTSGAMGYGVPAAIAAKLLAPERTVIAFAGDGDFLMTGQELATAVQYGSAIVVIVVDNGDATGRSACTRSGTIPGRVERHRPRQPGLRRARPGLRRLRREGHAHGGVPRRVRARARGRPPRAARTSWSTPRR